MTNANGFRLAAALVFALAACGKLPPASAGLGEACTRNADCAAPYVCGDGHCIVDEGRACTPAEKRCNGNTVERCKESGAGWDVEQTCATGCNEGACRPKVCEAGTRKCQVSTVYECLEDGSGWGFYQACPTLCDDANRNCRPFTCQPFTTRCVEGDPTKIETCDGRGSAWVATSCSVANGEAVCDAGQCKAKICAPGTGGTCERDVRTVCNATGTAYEPTEACAFGCTENADGTSTCDAPACAAGDLRCNQGAVEKCAPDRRSFAFVQYCPAGCSGSGSSTACVKPVCQPLQRICDTDQASGANIVRQCRADGSGYDVVETCSQACTQGTCVTDDAHCAVGELRCSGVEVQVCVRAGTGATQWQFSERCLGMCQNGACDGTGACGCTGAPSADAACGSTSRPAVVLNGLFPAGSSLPADGNSTVLLYTDPITDAAGNLLPDGTMVTFTQDGTDALLASQDADPARAGLQRPSLRGRARVLVKSPTQARDVLISAGLGGSCMGGLSLHYTTVSAGAHVAYAAEDFSTTRAYDRLATTAVWDPLRGMAIARPMYDFGTGSDGDLTATTTSTRDLFDEGFAKAWNVVGLGADRAQTDGFSVQLSPGDEVLLMNLASTNTNPNGVSPTAGVYEFKRVARVEAGAVVFTEPVRNQYGASDNVDLTGQKVVVQRVPQFNNVTVESAATLTVRGYANNGTGVLALRARGTVKVLGSLTVAERGLPPGVTQTGSTTGALPRLLLGSGQSRPGGGVLFVAAKSITVKTDTGLAQGTISASTTGGNGGSLWLQGASLALGSTGVVAQGPAGDGKVRLDYDTLDQGGTTRPGAFVGQAGAFLVQSSNAYSEPLVTSGSQPLIRAVTQLGIIGGAAKTVVGAAGGVAGLKVEISADGGSFFGVDGGRVSVSPAAKVLRFRAKMDALSDDPIEMLGIAFKIEAS